MSRWLHRLAARTLVWVWLTATSSIGAQQADVLPDNVEWIRDVVFGKGGELIGMLEAHQPGPGTSHRVAG